MKKNDTLASGGVAAVLITKQRTADLSFNEIDVARIKMAQKVNLTFDAVQGLNITGKVADIDTIGTVTQGVVTYSVKITFDTQDERVKPGMSVSAAIITDVKTDVIIVPNSAVKSQGDAHYVEMGVSSTIPPRQQTVEVGISNDSSTEIVSGLKEGDQVVTRTVLAQAAKPAATAPSLFGSGGRIGGGGGGGGGGRNGR